MTALCEPIEFEDDPTALYRLYDAQDALVYVGISTNPARRMVRHAETQPWWPEVVRKTMAWYPTRDEAAAAETAAIDAEAPKYNLIKNSNPNVGRYGSARCPVETDDLEAALGSSARFRRWGAGVMPA